MGGLRRDNGRVGGMAGYRNGYRNGHIGGNVYMSQPPTGWSQAPQV